SKLRRPARPALADDARNGWNLEPRHQSVRACDRTALSVLLGGDSGICARRVHERDQRKTLPVRELHHAHRLAVSLRMRRAEVAVDPVLDVAPLLLADDPDRSSVELSDTG